MIPLAVDSGVASALIAGGVSVGVTLATRLWLDRRAHRADLETDYRHEQQKRLQELIAQYHGGLLEHAVSWNYRVFNLFANVAQGWLCLDGNYRDTPRYYFHSSVYRFLSLLGLAQLFESEQIYIDARYVETQELEFVKFCKAFHWVMSDVALFKGVDYDVDEGPAHFTSDRLRSMCEAFSTDGNIPTFRQFEQRVLDENRGEPELEDVFRFFDGLSPGAEALRWDRLVCLHLLATAFVTTFGYDWQQSDARHFAQALSQVRHRQILDNFFDWLPRLGLEKQSCLLQIKEQAGIDSSQPASPERLDVVPS